MKTEILKINYESPEIDKINFAAEVLKNGGIVAFPTETVYGLGANALDEGSVKKIFEAKGRPSDNPLIVHISRFDDIFSLVKEVPKRAEEIIEKFCPGPLTIILDKSDSVPLVTSGGLNTVAIRIPNNKIALELIKMAGVPIAAPSANISGSPSPTCAEHVIHDLNGRVDIIIDGGCSSIGLESTVLDLSRDIPMILRPGGVTLEQLKDALSDVCIDPAILERNENIIARAPGMKYRHYAPKAKVIIIDGNMQDVVLKINTLLKEYAKDGIRAGVMATEQTKDSYKFGQVISLGDRNRIDEIASKLFTVLRDFDIIGVEVVLAESIENSGVGLAVMNRLAKAAGYNIIRV